MTSTTEPCPVCNAPEQRIEIRDGGERRKLRCERCGGPFTITTMAARRAVQDGLQAQLSAWIRERTEFGTDIEEIDSSRLQLIRQTFPLYTVTEKQRILLQALERRTEHPGQLIHTGLREAQFHSQLGKINIVEPFLDYPLAWASNESEFSYLLDALVARKLIDYELIGGYDFYKISPQGWEYLDSQSIAGASTNQVFVAMAFSEEMIKAWELGIEPAISDANFQPYRIDRQPHNERIDVKIMAEIKRSRFLVADVTGQRQGVYFEAGYALGLGLPVIWSVRKDELEKIHFDTRHYNHIVWESEDDLRSRLFEFVVAIVGTGNGRVSRVSSNE